MFVNLNYVSFSCRFHPTDWWHEVGCDHQEWTPEQLEDAINTNRDALKLVKNAPSEIREDLRDRGIAKILYLTEKMHIRSLGLDYPIIKEEDTPHE